MWYRYKNKVALYNDAYTFTGYAKQWVMRKDNPNGTFELCSIDWYDKHKDKSSVL